MSLEKPVYLRRTYCNPIAIPDCPRGSDPMPWENIMGYTGETKKDYRSISDPSVLFYDNKWYMYPSYGMAYVSEDFVTWKHVRSTPYDMDYSPSVIPWKGKFIMTSWNHGLYISDSPTGPFECLGDFIMIDGTEIKPCDSGLFLDDDGRIYIYWTGHLDTDDYCGSVSMGVELDRDNPRKFLSEPVILNKFNPDNWWERFGTHNQDTRQSWIEGQWMIKHNGRYYLIYATPGTEYKSYVMAAYYSDEGPLTGFVCQKNNPVTQSRSGIVSGAGHGCIAHGPDNSLWAFYTITHCAYHPYERRIGMDPIGVDENGELYCPGVTDTPQLGFGEAENPMEDNSAGLLPLTFLNRQCSGSSSWINGRETIYAFDESILTWWQPQPEDKEPYLKVNLRGQYVCEAMRIIWRDVDLDYDSGIVPGPYQYIIEGRMEAGKGEWYTVLDMRENREDYTVDYRTFPPVVCGELRLKITGVPKGIQPGVTSFAVFGTRSRD